MLPLPARQRNATEPWALARAQSDGRREHRPEHRSENGRAGRAKALFEHRGARVNPNPVQSGDRGAHGREGADGKDPGRVQEAHCVAGAAQAADAAQPGAALQRELVARRQDRRGAGSPAVAPRHRRGTAGPSPCLVPPAVHRSGRIWYSCPTSSGRSRPSWARCATATPGCPAQGTLS